MHPDQAHRRLPFGHHSRSDKPRTAEIGHAPGTLDVEGKERPGYQSFGVGCDGGSVEGSEKARRIAVSGSSSSQSVREPEDVANQDEGQA
jgi:hypothetical protein